MSSFCYRKAWPNSLKNPITETTTQNITESTFSLHREQKMQQHGDKGERILDDVVTRQQVYVCFPGGRKKAHAVAEG